MRLDDEQEETVREYGFPVTMSTERDDEEGCVEYYVLVGPEINRKTVWYTRVDFGKNKSNRPGGHAFVAAAKEQQEISRLCIKFLKEDSTESEVDIFEDIQEEKNQ